MTIEDRCERLKSIYSIYDAFIAGTPMACRKQCAWCCTCNVTATTLEGWLIDEHLRSDRAVAGAAAQVRTIVAPDRRFQPRVTINGMARLCMQGRPVPDELNDPAAGDCPLIEEDICPIYDVRPFGCRAMLSTVACGQGGQADMPPLILSVNSIVMQFIEGLDQPGASGNLIDILTYFSDADRRGAYEQQKAHSWPQPLVPNQTIPEWMIPPEHRKAVQPLLESLSKGPGKNKM